MMHTSIVFDVCHGFAAGFKEMTTYDIDQRSFKLHFKINKDIDILIAKIKF